MAERALNHRLSQGTQSDIVGGFDTLELKESPEAMGYWQQLMAGANRFGPQRSHAALGTQLHHPLQLSHKRLTDRHVGLLQCG